MLESDVVTSWKFLNQSFKEPKNNYRWCMVTMAIIHAGLSAMASVNQQIQLRYEIRKQIPEDLVKDISTRAWAS